MDTLTNISTYAPSPQTVTFFSEMGKAIGNMLNAEGATSGKLAAITEALAAPPTSELFDVFGDVLRSEAYLAHLAENSQFNTNGFYKIRLCVSEHLSLRLHIWWPGTHGKENLHSHRWPLVSRVLSGRLAAEYWEDALTSDGLEMNEFHYKDGTTPLRLVGQTRVTLDDAVVYDTGHSYYMTADNLHRVAADEKVGCSTLMVRFNNTRSWARNLMNAGDDLDVSPKKCGIEDVEKALLWLLASK